MGGDATDYCAKISFGLGKSAVFDQKCPGRANPHDHSIGLLHSATDATLHPMKSRVITQRELRNDSGAILREVEAGRTVIVSRNGTPVGELRPIRRRRFVPRAAIADAAKQAVRIDAGRFRADLDAFVDPHARG